MLPSKIPLSALARAAFAALLALSGCSAPTRVVVVHDRYDAAPPPPPPQVEVIGIAPGPRAVWVRGHWVWRRHHWVWVRGHWRW